MSEEAWSIDSAFEFFVNKLHEYNMKPKDGHVESPSDVMDVGRDDGKVFPDDGEEKDRYREEGQFIAPFTKDKIICDDLFSIQIVDYLSN